MKWIKANKNKLLIISIAIMHLVGLIGLTSTYSDYFVKLTPINLLVTFILLLLAIGKLNLNFILFFVLSFGIGMLVEIMGVKTGFPFGNYYYTNILSISILGVPILIGINWFMLSYGIINLINQFFSKNKLLFKSFIAAVSMMFLDILIEPFAIKNKLWVWQNPENLIQNYLAWFIISFLIFIPGFILFKHSKNIVGAVLIFIYFVFFGLNFFV